MSSPQHASSPASVRMPSRVLACVLCQQRKVKCDRNFPCKNCVRSRAQCVPATAAPRRRSRRFPERDLLERIRKYEDLMRQNNIQFNSLDKDAEIRAKAPDIDRDRTLELDSPVAEEVDKPSPATTARSDKTVYQPKSFWHALNEGTQASDEESEYSPHHHMGETVVKKAWDSFFENADPLFGSRKTAVDLSTLHPEPVQIFRLWQIYLDNVDPLLKVTHTPTLQGSLIEAASNVKNIDPTLEALMFSIYSISALTLTNEECLTMFGSSQRDLIGRCQFGCQQALLNCGFLRTDDRICLIALYLYLVSARPSTDPRSLSSLLGIAVRIAQRMGIHMESSNTRCTALEGEMRRRLWWQLVLFDLRVGEMADYKAITLTPTWDCRIPLNVNDFDLRPEMKELPVAQGQCSEALFSVVRCELANFVRYTAFHLDFACPPLKLVAKDIQGTSIPEAEQLINIEKFIEDKYFKYCNMENPLHFMTIWTTRAYLGKCRLIEHYARFISPSTDQTDKDRDAAFSYALYMLHSDTMMLKSARLKRFHWLLHFYFPFPAYIHIVNDMKRRPRNPQAEKAWRSMSDNYESRGASLYREDSPFFRVFYNLILQAWAAYSTASERPEGSLQPPKIVSDLQRTIAQWNQKKTSETPNMPPPDRVPDAPMDELSMSMMMDLGAHSSLYSLRAEDGIDMEPWAYSSLSIQPSLDLDTRDIDWPLGL